VGGARGRKLALGDRQAVTALVREACAAGARREAACAVLGVSPRSLQRWAEGGGVKADGRLAAARGRVPANKLAPAERQRILAVANSAEFAALPPSQMVPRLADKGEYIASESSVYRVLREDGQMASRGKAKAPSRRRPPAWVADAPNQLWSWDITYLASTVAGLFFYLYLIMDVFSRKIVGWEVHTEQGSDQAAVLFRQAHLREGVGDGELALHSDNGSPMKGATLLVTLQKLGVVASFSRPSVSNDNPYSESLFKTCKYRPGFPGRPFESLEQARAWVAGFAGWYNDEHRHSGIRFVTPGERHRGEDIAVLEQRKRVYEAARREHPERWSGGIRNWERPATVALNPDKSNHQKRLEPTQKQN
jgi:transposase InsO family protein